MKSPSDNPAPAVATLETDNAVTGLPVLRTWRMVYLLVLVLFVVCVALLLILERTFS